MGNIKGYSMQTLDEKVDTAVHVAMEALGLSVEGDADTASILNDFIYNLCHDIVTSDE